MGYGGASVLDGITKHINSQLLQPKLRDNQKNIKMIIANEMKSMMVGIPTSKDLDKVKNDANEKSKIFQKEFQSISKDQVATID